MALKINTTQHKFVYLQLEKLEVDRRMGSAQVVVSYLDEKEALGSVTLPAPVLSQKTRDLLVQLFTSIEEDAHRRIFGEIHTEQEGIADGPKGIVEPEEVGDQV